MANRPKKKRSPNQNVHRPSEEALKQIIHDFKLGPRGASALKEAIEKAVSHIQAHQRQHLSPDERKALIVRMRNLEQVLGNLLYEIDRSHHMMLDYLPSDFLMKLGARSSTAFVKEVLGDKSISPRLDLDIQLEAQEGKSVNLAKVEELARPLLEAIGLKSGPALFRAYIRDLHESLRVWRIANGKQSSGRPNLSYRKYVILNLAVRAPEIIGKPAPKSPTGVFVDLCVRVLPECGLTARGVDKSIPGVIGMLRPEEGRAREKTS